MVRWFPRSPPVNINMNLLNTNNRMDAVIMCCDLNPDPPNILESDKVTFFCSKLHNYIITISKRHTVRLCHSRGWRLFLGKVHWNPGPEGWLSQSFIFPPQTLAELKFLASDTFFRQKCEEESVGQAAEQTYLSTYICCIFFLIQVAKDSYSYVLFGHVMLLCRSFL